MLIECNYNYYKTNNCDKCLIKLGNDRLELRRLRRICLCVIKYYIILLIYTQKIFFTMSSIIKTRGNLNKLIVPNSTKNSIAN